jgi:glucose-6-phosphate isomerase
VFWSEPAETPVRAFSPTWLTLQNPLPQRQQTRATHAFFWRDTVSESLAYRQDISGCLEAAIGPHGLDHASLAAWSGQAEAALEGLRGDYESGALALLGIVEETADIEAAEAALAKLSVGADTIIFFGTGGSGLGGQTLAQIAGWGIPHTPPKPPGQRPRIRFYDNLDGGTLSALLRSIDFTKTRFIVTSKSGGTAETLAQAIATLSAVNAAGLGDTIPSLFLGITEQGAAGKANGLRALFQSLGIPMLAHHTGIGGRFSCLTNVGLMPAIARGLDARAIRAGARSILQPMIDARPAAEIPFAVGAATMVGLSKERGIRTLVLMPYADRLGKMADWYVQLWAESLGKGGEGTTPVPAIGPVDQHSQLQLFMDGPREIATTIIRVATKGAGPLLDNDMTKTAGLAFLGGKTIGDIVDAQGHAVAEALQKAGRPVRTIDLDTLDERAAGALLMHFMMETIVAGRLLKLDPFDQPAVELAKILTKQRLGG